MSCCCDIDTVSGAPPSGGGGAVVTSTTWTEVYRIDFRDQGPVDLLPASSTVVIDGVTWTSGSVVAGATSFEIEAAGLRAVGPVSTVFDDSAQTAPHIFVPLGSLTPSGSVFAFSPAMEYRFEVFVSAHNGAANDETAGVAMYTPTIDPPAATRSPQSDPRLIVIGKGFANGVADGFKFFQDPTNDTTTRADADVLTLDVPVLHFQMTQNMVSHAGAFSGGDFGTDAQIKPVTGWRGNEVQEPEYYGDPDFSRLALVFEATNINGTFDATIEQFRILQK